MRELSYRALTTETWDAWAELVERHNGVWGGCWCVCFHGPPTGSNRELKRRMVEEVATHSSVVFDGERAVGWCQFGKTDDLPRIKHKKQYLAEMDGELPDWRITCFFVDKEYRKKGVTSVALAGAMELIARAGGGVVESYPEDVTGRKTSGSFLYNATVTVFERQGFERVRRLGKNHWVVRKTVEPV